MEMRPNSIGNDDASPRDRFRILISAQDSARSVLIKLLGDIFETIHDEIDGAAESTDTKGVRTAIARRAKITRATLDRLDRFWADFAISVALPSSRDLLSGDMARLADKALQASRPAYDRLAKRLAELHSHASVEIDHIPLDPGYLVLTFCEALEEHGIHASSALAMISAFDLEVLQRLDELYDTLSHFLAACGIRADETIPDVRVDRLRGTSRSQKLERPSRDQAPTPAEDQSTLGRAEPVTPTLAPGIEVAATSTPVADATIAETDTSEPWALGAAAIANSSSGGTVEPVGKENAVAIAGPEAAQSSPGSSSGTDTALPIGSWVALHIGSGPSVRAKLSWRSPLGKMLFVDAQGKKVAQLSEKEAYQAMWSRF